MNVNQADNAPDGEPVDDFDAAMDEIAAGNESPANAADDNANAPVEPSASDDQPLEKSDGEEQAAGTPPASEQPSDDIWKDAPQALREAYEREKRDLGYKLASANGRVSALDRKLAELAKAPAGTQSDNEGSAGEADEGGKPNRFESPEIVKLKEDYGDIAAPLIGLIQEQADQIAKLTAPVQALETGRTEAARQEQYSILEKAHPDWRTLSLDERWGGWIETQPRAVQEAYLRNVDVSDGVEAAFVLDLFKKEMGITPAPTPPSVDPRRQRQLDAGRDGGRSGGLPTTNEVPADDFEAALDAAQAKSEKRRQGNRVSM